MIEHSKIYNQAQLMQLIQQVGFLPLLDSGISGYYPRWSIYNTP